LNQTEQHYSAYKKELHGLVHSISHFRYYLLGKQFEVRSDHKGLEWLLTTRAKANGPLIYRWQDILGEYDFKITYVAGTRMRHADGLSRRAYRRLDVGNIRNLPNFHIAQHSSDDSFWLPQMKVKDVAALGRPQRTRRLPAHLCDPNIEVDLPPSLLQDIVPNSPAPTVHNAPLPPTAPTMSGNEERIDIDPAIEAEPELELQVDGDLEDWAEPGPSTPRLQTRAPSDHGNPAGLPDPDERIDAIRRAQQCDRLTRTILQYVCNRPQHSDFSLKDKLRPLRLPDHTYNILIRKRHEFVLGTNDLLYVRLSKRHLPLVIPGPLQNDVMRQAHDHEATLHPGIDRTMHVLERRAWWPDMRNDVTSYIRACNTCIMKNRLPSKNVTILGRTTTRLPPAWSTWSADVLHFPKKSGRHNCVLTLMDYRTRWLEAYPMSNEQAPTIVNTLEKNFTKRYGYNITVTTDRAKAFLSDTFRTVCRTLNMHHRTVLPYGPNASPVERAHRSLNDGLRILLEPLDVSKWGDALD
jgi:hypothetical protein